LRAERIFTRAECCRVCPIVRRGRADSASIKVDGVDRKGNFRLARFLLLHSPKTLARPSGACDHPNLTQVRTPVNSMSRRSVVAAALLALFAVGFYSGPVRSCDADEADAQKPHAAAPAANAQAHPASAPAAKPAVAATQPPVTAGAAPNDDAGSNLAEGVGPASGTHRRGLRWQSFLPGVIK
jgi:hypothetical protein